MKHNNNDPFEDLFVIITIILVLTLFLRNFNLLECKVRQAIHMIENTH